MNRKEIMNVLENLSYSQGFYGRLIRDIERMDEEDREAFWELLEEKDFHGPLDVVMYFEC